MKRQQQLEAIDLAALAFAEGEGSVSVRVDGRELGPSENVCVRLTEEESFFARNMARFTYLFLVSLPATRPLADERFLLTLAIGHVCKLPTGSLAGRRVSLQVVPLEPASEERFTHYDAANIVDVPRVVVPKRRMLG